MTTIERPGPSMPDLEGGTGCAKLHDDQMRNLTCRRIQCDEIWSYVRVKQANIAKGAPRQRIGVPKGWLKS